MTLRQMLQSARGALRIPAYQRRYVWGDNEDWAENRVVCLTKELIRAAASAEDVFMQAITLVRRADGCEVVDGQQRLTYLWLLLRHLGAPADTMVISYDCRPKVERWLQTPSATGSDTDCQDVHCMRRTCRILERLLPQGQTSLTADYVLDHVELLCMELPSRDFAVGAYKILNGTKAPMHAEDVIKGAILSMASDPAQPHADETSLATMRMRYTAEWESWVRWWNSPAVRDFFEGLTDVPLGLLLRLTLRSQDADMDAPLTYREFSDAISTSGEQPWHAAKHFMYELRKTQHHVMSMLDDAGQYNRVRAIMLLQNRAETYKFLHAALVRSVITPMQLEKIYKLSFLGMDYTEIEQGASGVAKFEDMLASLSMADVYHSEAKRDVFNLLLRLNIDEDIKLGRKFDFSIWNNRSLEHIYSKSKVWHRGRNGELLDGNDNPLRMPLSKLLADKSYLCRDDIVNHDGARLTEHCIGNLVLLYGQNNAAFGNVGFEEKKMMFLAPGDLGVFRSRNLLHSVFVFAGERWTAQSIVDNYNLTLKNLKLYYGYK